MLSYIHAAVKKLYITHSEIPRDASYSGDDNQILCPGPALDFWWFLVLKYFYFAHQTLICSFLAKVFKQYKQTDKK
jgi:hypothetical protein